jgi:hypothetical protein
MGSVGWTDPTGTYLWLFGGFSYSTSGITTAAAGGNELADLWVFSTTTGTWTWMGGPSYPSTTGGNTLTLAYSVPGIFATTVGTSSTFNSPGARMWSTGWQDANGNFWLFGGAGNDVAASFGSLNDLWQMQIATAPK